MKYVKAHRYDEYSDLMMGPNPVKLAEELLRDHQIPAGATVMDLGCGRGLTSVFLVREYGFRVFAADLWGSPTENKRFFDQLGLTSQQIVPIHADATALPFAEEFFDAVVCVDAYNYFGRDPDYLGQRLLPWVKPGGYIYIAVPGMKQDCHHDIPPALLLSWDAEQLDYIHAAAYWRQLISLTDGAEIISVHEMESNEECWDDWLRCDNEYALEDRKAMEAGAGQYLNFVAIIVRRR